MQQMFMQPPEFLIGCTRGACSRCLPWMRRRGGLGSTRLDGGDGAPAELAEVMLPRESADEQAATTLEAPSMSLPATAQRGMQQPRSVTARSGAGGAPPPEAAAARTAAAVPPARPTAPQRHQAAYGSVDAAILLSLLPRERWSLLYIRDEDCGAGDSECRVCLCDYEPDEEIVRLPCLHYAHASCMEQWLLQNPRCPICCVSVRDVLQTLDDGV
eukprot:TRINITY_DN18351_c0_g1_i2.p1 TRINITY_DN18351_c0_g1~~TRINITY_DN18351_c0_g1_i2.p1  ORF type:complete len:215 (-),score=35.12 TRINITY_DN18351_c0_g1_i2:59-703(-)